MLPGVALVMVPETVLEEVPVAVVDVVDVVAVLDGLVSTPLTVLVVPVPLVGLLVEDVFNLSLFEGIRVLEEGRWELRHERDPSRA